MVTVEDVVDRLESRAANHDMTVENLLEKMPFNVVDDHKEVNAWLDEKDISHKLPTSTHPELRNDPNNWVWEDSSVNRARGDEPMTDLEVIQAELDGYEDAARIDGGEYDVIDSDWADVLIENDIPFDIMAPEIWWWR